MGLLDAVLRREQHVFRTALPPDECRRRLGSGLAVFPPQTPIVNPFVTFWTSSDHARLRLPQVGGRGPAARIMRVHLIPDGSGTVVDGTTQLPPSQLAVGLLVLSGFSFIGILFTAASLSDGVGLPQALDPFGYIALFVLFMVIVTIVLPSRSARGSGRHLGACWTRVGRRRRNVEPRAVCSSNPRGIAGVRTARLAVAADRRAAPPAQASTTTHASLTDPDR